MSFVVDPGKIQIVIFGLDGALLNATQCRPDAPSNKIVDFDKLPAKQRLQLWHDYISEAIDDPPFMDIVMLNQSLHMMYDIHIITGRFEALRYHTRQWMQLHNIYFSELHMRSDNDYRPTAAVKRDILHKLQERNLQPVFAVETLPSVINMWREEGVRCLQVHEPMEVVLC